METAKFNPADLLDQVLMREKHFHDHWWKDAEQACEIYDADSKNKSDTVNPYNILYSNTEVLLPSLFSATPKPDIRARFHGQQVKPIPEVLTRFLTLAADASNPGADSLYTSMSDATLAALVPGAGVIRLRLVEGAAFPLTYESVHYRCFVWGKANRWAKVPWISFKHPLKKGAMQEKFKITDEDMTASYTPDPNASDEEKDDCCVYEVWHRASGKIYYVSEQWAEKVVHEAEDPLKLQGFFPTPGPMLFTAKPGRLSPTPLYNYYRNQAEELNRVTVRLNRILSAIKVRGAYNGLLGKDLEALLTSDDNENKLIAAGEAGLLAQSGGFDKHIWMLPIEKLITVAQELYRAREAVKQVIYEITGISDIIRGSSVASETATAQDLKNKWGTVRLRKMQTIVADYARDLFRLTVDAGTHALSPEQWKEITQFPFPTAQEKAVAQQALQYAQQTAMPGMPPPPGLEQYQKTLSMPSWEEILAKISSDAQRSFLVNVQTDSTVDLDTAADKAEVTEFMNAMGQLLSGLQPLMALGPQGVEVLKAILMGVAQRFKFGLDMGEAINMLSAQAAPAQPEQTGPSEEEKAALAQEQQFKMADIASKMRIMQAEERLKMAEIAAAERRLQIDLDLAALRLQQAQAKIPPQSPQPSAA